MKFILAFLISILSFVSIAQTSNYVDYIGWKTENPKEWGSFYWKVTRTEYKHTDGYYYYKVYFYSNSVFSVKDAYGKYPKAVTYITNPRVTMTTAGRPYYYNVTHALIDYKSYYFCWFYETTGNATFDVTFSSCYPYNNSNERRK